MGSRKGDSWRGACQRTGMRAETLSLYSEDFCIFVGSFEVVLRSVLSETVKSEGDLNDDNVFLD